jgi:filamentous hemagglutinin family protein
MAPPYSRELTAFSVAVSVTIGGFPIGASATELPVPCVATSCGSAVAGFVTSGAATASAAGNALTVTQASDAATLNWQSFNISADGKVQFVQPGSSSVALNRIWQGSASEIFGSLSANGRVYLLNQNGVLFGQDSVVNVGGLLASSLNLGTIALENGLGAAGLQGQPALTAFTDADGNALPSGAVRIAAGASITAADGGQVLVFAPEIESQGTISTPGGQTLLAAGSPIYLATSSDANLRGFLVEVGSGGTVTNGSAANAGTTDPATLLGQIVAERGNVTLAGLTVNQYGRVSATTTVRENGSIRLQARDGGSAANIGGTVYLTATQGGALTLGARSVTEVGLSTDGETSVDANAQPESLIELQGRQIGVLEAARVSATGGAIEAVARANPLNSAESGIDTDDSRITLAAGAVLDVSGAEVELAMERNVVQAELRGDELADSPLQRDGVLRGTRVAVDARESGTREDGTSWQGTPLADVSGQISLVQRDVAERNSTGGSVTLSARGEVQIAEGATIDMSGGAIQYRDGYIATTQLVGADGRIYDIGSADPDRRYTGVVSAYEHTDARWGVTETYAGFETTGSFVAGYVEGKDAGTLQVSAPRARIDGDILGEVAIGRYQREAATALADQQVFRAYDELPLGAKLIVGAEPEGGSIDQVAGDVVIASASPEAADAILLRPELFGEDKVARLEVHANGSVTLDADSALALPGQGKVEIHAGRIAIAGDISAASGDIALEALETAGTSAGEVDLRVAADATLDVRGQWVNEDERFASADDALPARLTDGGSVSLRAVRGSLTLEPGSLIDASAGARRDAGGGVHGGRGGDISLAAIRGTFSDPEVRLQQGAELRALALADGGSLSISAPEVCLTEGDACAGQSESALTLAPDALIAGGFSGVTLRSNTGGLGVAAGTLVELRQRNVVLDDTAAEAPSGTALQDIASVAELADHEREALDLRLQASIAAPVSGGYTNEQFADVPGLVLGAGSVIRTDPGAAVTLVSNSTLVVDGVIEAPAGEISLQLDNTLAVGEALDAQGIWLNAGSRLDASGVVQLVPNEEDLRSGEVLDGGTVSLLAQRGAVIVNPGAQIDVSGTSGVLDLRTFDDGQIGYTPQLIASDGGSVRITAAEGAVLGGTLSAQAGAGSAGAEGGRLEVLLDGNQRQGNAGAGLYTTETRRVVIAQDAPALTLATGTALPAALAGKALLGADTIAAAGFDTVALGAATTQGTNAFGQPQVATGEIHFDGDVTLALGRELTLDAAQLSGTDGDVALAAPSLRLGHEDRTQQDVAAPVARGAGAFAASGSLIEVVGHSSIDGFASVVLDSAGDLRLRGVQLGARETVQGSLSSGADVTLRAQQVYASTLSDFAVSVTDTAGGVLRIEAAPGDAADVLSAGSHLTLTAPVIEQAGVLRAPLGTIELQAGELRLESGSLTSTSAEGLTIPFGSLQAGSDWTYALDDSTQVIGVDLALPEKQVVLAGERVSVAEGAVIDVSGGGDLLAYEFVPGTGGTRDVLSALESPGLYAIVPGLDVDYAPYDPQESAGAGPGVGQRVHIEEGAAGLPAGDYVLLPARYALLEGGYTIRLAEGFTDLQAGEVVPRLDGSAIAPGRLGVSNTGFEDARSSGFVLTPGSTLAKQAQYDTALASEFFDDAGAGAAAASSRRPQDAGVLALIALSQLDIDGTLRAAAAEGRGAAVDLSAANLRVTDSDSAGTGEVLVSATQLAALGAESLLLGGRRSTTASGIAVDVAAQTVTIDGDAVLGAPELLLAATDTVTVRSGAALAASGDVAAIDTIAVQGDGAFLRLAAGEQTHISRDGASGARGTLVLESGAALSAGGGALALDATLDTRSEATLALAQGSLSLGSSRISLGEAAPSDSGLALSAAEIAALQLDELVLASRSSVDLYGDVDFDVKELRIDAAGLRGIDAAGSSEVSATGAIELSNRDARDVAAATGGIGTLALRAEEIRIGEGVQTLSGYDSVTLAASAGVRGTASGGLSVQGGDLAVIAPALTVDTGSSTTLVASGNLSVESGGAAVAAGASGLGGTLRLEATGVTVATHLEAASGTIEIAATDSVTLAAGAVLNAAGRLQAFDGVAVPSRAGTVRLSSSGGDVSALDGSTIDVGAAGDGEAGTLIVHAPGGRVVLAGELDGAATTAAASGTARIDAAQLGDLSTLNATLNAGGFEAERSLRQRGSGDLLLAAGSTLRSLEVALTADQGSVVIDGTIDASGADGGRVVLSADTDVNVGGVIRAVATTDTGAGGDVALRARNGGIRLASAASVDVSAGADAAEAGGRVDLRLTRAAALSMLDADAGNDQLALQGSIAGARRIAIEAYETYDDADGVLADGALTAASVAADSSNVLYAEAVTFMESADAIVAALGLADASAAQVLPGIEMVTAGNLSLGADNSAPLDWDLSSWRFGAGGAPGVLTLRAAGDLTFNGSLSDGFAGVSGANAFKLAATPSDSWSYRLIAGADAASADVLATADAVAVSGADGSVRIAAGTVASTATGTSAFRMVRTGRGSIDVAAAGNFELGNRASVLYTAGVAAADRVTLGTGALGLGGREYPTDGGDIRIRAQGDVRGAQTHQLVTDWLWRAGKAADTAPTGSATGWTVNFARFEQNVAALGGGDVTVEAGGDIRDFSASVVASGKQVAGKLAADSRVEVVGGGDLQVEAGGDVAGGSYYVGLGEGRLRAGRDITDSQYGEAALNPLLALGDGSWDVSAGGSAAIEAVVNPTLLPQGRSQGTLQGNKSTFSTYAPDAAVTITATGGDVELTNRTDVLSEKLTSMNWTDATVALQLYAPRLAARALSGDLLLSGKTTLFPSAQGAVQLYAAGSVRRGDDARDVVVYLPDVDPDYAPSVAAPRDDLARVLETLESPENPSSNLHAATPLHAASDAVAHVVARDGDIEFPGTKGSGLPDTSILYFATPARVVAGGDIVDLPLTVQHDDGADISSVVAGGDLRYSINRTDNGSVAGNFHSINVDGPGTLQLSAGGDIDLQTSAGVTSRGNLVNSHLPDGGASISAMAGAAEQEANYDSMIARYLAAGSDYDAVLAAYLVTRSGVEPTDKSAALAALRAMSRSQQRPLLEAILYAELRASGRDAARSGSGDFSRGFQALETLFPGSTPDDDPNTGNPYAGDLRLFFSRMYTLDGGDISLLAPGGAINVGLATPPAAFGLSKAASELGLVAQGRGNVQAVAYGDFEVNESRVFAADGGDILVWSSDADIDAGRGAKTAISAPSPVITYDDSGAPIVTFPPALTGSGIQTLATSDGTEPGDVDLYAPRGIVNAGDAGIVAGNLTVAATAVLGADNIQVSGVSLGVPVDTGGLGAALSGVSAVASGASNAAAMGVDSGGNDAQQQAAPLAEAAMSWLEVFVLGLGEENCRQDDLECLKRQK